jgi:uncharacterized membrane protein
MAEKTKQRLVHIDWMRGLACLLMFQTHCYDSWLGGEARSSKFFKWSQLGGTLPAPLFLFLAGISFALVTDKLRQRGVAANQIAHTTIRRGAEIFGLGVLFRGQEFLLGQPSAPWTDLLRVDVLNIIGLSMILMGLVCRLAGATAPNNAVASGLASDVASSLKNTRVRARTIVAAAIAALAIALATPPLWTTHRPRWLPWFLESYLNGVHIFREPQPWLFPLFPWAAFAFVGLAVGLLLSGNWPRRREASAFALVGAGGLVIAALAWWLDARPRQLYAVYDFWHTSPNFFLIRVGVLLVILFGSYAWCRWGAGQWGFSPLAQLGQTSLLVYWVHIEFVYGRFSILPKRAVSIHEATLGLLGIFLAMLLLSVTRTRLKGSRVEVLGWLRRAARPASEG